MLLLLNSVYEVDFSFSFPMQSRLSPFANSKARTKRKVGKESCCRSKTSKSDKLKKWFSLVDAATLAHKRALPPVGNLRDSLHFSSELHRTLYGFIVFEVSWTNVRGINYLNELQVLVLLHASYSLCC